MAIAADSPIGFLMQWWPFVIAALFVLLYLRRLRARVIGLFFAAILIGYGAQMIVGYPMSLWSRALAKVAFGDDFELGGAASLLIVYGSATLITVLLVWLLAWQLGRNTRESSVGA